ncbi:MAG: cupin domain-containing protein [Solirubrobacteraceae bacterium]
MPDPEIVIRNVGTVTEKPIASLTIAGDQGWARELITTQINGSPDLYVSVFRMDPGQYHPLHAHPNVGELYYVLEGRCELRIGDRSEWVEAGTAAYMPRNVPHSVRTADQGVTILVTFPEGDLNKVEKVWKE